MELPESQLNLSEKLIRGLKKYNLTLNDLRTFKYCGGDGGGIPESDEEEVKKTRHSNYYKLMFGNKDFPHRVHNCICGHEINENCYISDGNQMLILGNCCIKRFIPPELSGRTCELCKNPHKNRKYNLCNDCKVTYKRCDGCNEYFEFRRKSHKYCLDCYKNEIEENDDTEDSENTDNTEDTEDDAEIERREMEIEEARRKNIKAKKGFINATQVATKIRQIKQCTERNENYETTDMLENECLCNSCKLNKQQLIDAENMRLEEENVRKQQRLGLMCYCKLKTDEREVTKDTPNKGKIFCCCPKYYEYKCNYFMWKSESLRKIDEMNARSCEGKLEQELNETENNDTLCYCNLPVVLREVQKDTPNKGRFYYTCPQRYSDKCKYFAWK